MEGHCPEQTAALLDVRLTTVRWHLASMFRKTGTGRQAELVRALLSLRRL
jgi:DNA-binding CsgD family transcriptional regulator